MGGNYFLINEDWNDRGIVLMLAADDASLRLEFVNF